MILHDSPLAHIHCPACGREMRPGTSCMVCESARRLAALGLAGPVGPGGVVDEAPTLGGVPRPVPPGPAASEPPAAITAGLVPPSPRAGAAFAGDGALERPTVGPLRPAKRRFRPMDIWKRYLPPVRLVWVFLLGIAWEQGGFDSAAQAGPILAVLFLGVVTDLGFQWVRFPRLRVPDAALATSLFLALIIWPGAVDYALVSIAVTAVGLRHVLRVGGHPLLNPAAAGIALATVLFGMSTSWHVGLTPTDSIVMAVLGAVLVARAPHTFRLPIGYFAAFMPLTVALTVALGGARHLVLLLEEGALGPASIFFGMFMVTEPRTAPSARPMMWVFAISVGVVSAALPVVFTEVTALGAFGVLAPFLALFVGNVLTVALPSARGARRPTVSRPVAPATPAGVPSLSK